MSDVVIFDLDDTLYKEIDYLKSAYKEIASYATQRSISRNEPTQIMEVKLYEVMLAAYKNGENTFNALNDYTGLGLPIEDLIRIYHEHIPHISLDDDVRYILDKLKADGIMMGIISDGRKLTQWNKIKALGLTKWINESCIIINTSADCYKPSPNGYDRLMYAVHALSKEKNLNFIYVGDNLKKDFIYPKQKGWQTICLKDDGRNIHYQDFTTAPAEALPDKVVKSFKDIII